MKRQIQQLLERILENMGLEDSVNPVVSVPENPANGDYTSNIAMAIFSNAKFKMLNAKWKIPREFANELKDAIKKDQMVSDAGIIDRVEVAGPGFLNIYLTEANLSTQVEQVLKLQDAYGFAPKTKKNGDAGHEKQGLESKNIKQKLGKNEYRKPQVTTGSSKGKKSQNILRKNIAVDYSDRQNGTDQQVLSQEFISANAKKRVMVEFAHPNTHKAFHIGHLRNITSGETVVRLLESQGHIVIRANYQGDVGMHIAKCLYGITHIEPFKSEFLTLKSQDIHIKVEFLGKVYAAGSKAYEESEDAKAAIAEINKQIYARIGDIYGIYKETRQWSLEYFQAIYKRVGSHFDRLYFESETYESGKKNVLEGLRKGIFQESDGAIIFSGEKYDLHTRVFITKEGNATYEGKDMGLAPLQHSEHHPDFIVHVLGPEQFQYTRVIFQALDLLFPKDAGKQYHLVYGWVNLKHGKMSSRLGNVVLGEWLLDEAKKSIYKILETSRSSDYTKEEKERIAEKAAVAAVKYSFLKVGLSGDIAFDIEASVSFEGDSGPYLQYTYARCKSVLRKSSSLLPVVPLSSLNPDERILARQIMQFPDVVAEAAQNFTPNTICTYLFHLAQQFNLFYAKNPILGSDTRLALTAATAQVIKNGLYLLGIDVLEQM